MRKGGVSASLLALATFIAAVGTFNLTPVTIALAQETRVGPSGLPLPRFVSLKSGRVNARVGPGLNYAISWLYIKAGLPVEIIQEFDNWRKIRDSEGAVGWVNQSLLSGRRTILAAPWEKDKEQLIPVYSQPQDGARLIAQVEPGAFGQLQQCNGTWCQISFNGREGWMDQTRLWGAYPGEKIEE
ncbi:SH3 domain-containing protein [Limoniibacter endophyticus]|uniref:SH3-like domain-containing protein n=1 Tax=Limoniibacter endophyticus TaxID=1565040 RepID=A0A8J3DMB8_9HYPH|nr:SH3 domain-containing protein [Limoniibacter endophyticus]GHC67046.1 hypothetical protein GCM10010136_10750 [Limoniibacter endophyticus]